MDFTQSMDNGYMIPTSVAVGSGEATDIRCVCDTVEDFKTFLDTTEMDLRYEGLITYEKVNKLLKVYKGNDTWQTVGEGGGGVDTSSFITLTQLSQQLSNYYTKAQTDDKIAEEIAKAQLSEGNKSVSYKMAGKKWLVIGDSITAKTHHSEKNYHDFISEETGCTVVNYGKDGWTIVQMCNEISKMPNDIDVVTLFMGTNDWHIGNVPLGNFLDTGLSSVGGAINEMLNSLIAKYGNKSIIVFSPLQRYKEGQYGLNASPNNRGYTLIELVDMLKKTCEHYSIKFFDLYRGSGFHMTHSVSRNEFFTDGLHPNIKGHKELGLGIMLPFIENNIKVTIGDLAPSDVYGNIIISKSSITLNKGENDVFTVKLDKQPSSEQTITLSKNSDNIVLSTSKLTFTPSNWNVAQSVTINANEDSITEDCTITLTSLNVSSKSINISVVNNDNDSNPPLTSSEITNKRITITKGKNNTLFTLTSNVDMGHERLEVGDIIEVEFNFENGIDVGNNPDRYCRIFTSESLVHGSFRTEITHNALDLPEFNNGSTSGVTTYTLTKKQDAQYLKIPLNIHITGSNPSFNIKRLAVKIKGEYVNISKLSPFFSMESMIIEDIQ